MPRALPKDRGHPASRQESRAVVSPSVARLFPNSTLLDVLALLMLHPDREFYQREIAQRTGKSIVQVQRALRRIVDAGLAVRTGRGNRVYYAAERRHPAYEDLKRVLLKTIALGDALRAALRALPGDIQLAFIFGSLAAGTESSGSDVDLLLVGNLKSRKASAILGPLGRQLGREFNPILYPSDEFRKKAKKGNRFIQELLQGPKIWLIGSDDELARLLE